MDAFGYDVSDFIPSELSGNKAVDIHHLVSRKKGGKDVIENLMALERWEHEMYGDKAQYLEWLREKHFEFMLQNGVPIKKYN